MRHFWLLFSQSVTIALGVLLVLTLFRPDWRPWTAKPAVIRQMAPCNCPAVATDSYRVAAARAIPSVVNVFSSKSVRVAGPAPDNSFFRRFFGRGSTPSQVRRTNNLGSGVIVSADGYILTNHHVVAAADKIQVALYDGRTLVAHVVGSDPDTDLAVLKIDASHLPAIVFASSDKASIGDVVLAIGDPFGVGQTVTMGIISALRRSHLGINTFEDFIQTDAPINPGNSGGPLVNTSGELVGINSAIYSRSGGSQGIGFAIPSDLAMEVMQQIIQHGTVIRGWIGVEVQNLPDQMRQKWHIPATGGALVAGVLRRGPADVASIQPGDVILRINGTPVSGSAQMLNDIAAISPGSRITLQLWRSGKPYDSVVTVARRPELKK